MTTVPELDEGRRLQILQRYSLLDTGPEEIFDCIARVTARLLEVPKAGVTLIDENRQWFIASVGTPDREIPRALAFCNETIKGNGPLVVPDLREDPRFAANPLVSGPPDYRFYAGTPLEASDGMIVGTLCAMDHRPRTLTSAQVDNLEDLAAIATHALRLRLVSLQNEYLTTTLREIGVGVVATDPRLPDNPIVFSNPAFSDITGYPTEAFIGRNCRFLQGPDTDPRMVEEIRAAIREKRTFRGLLLNYRQDGVPFWNELTIAPVFTESGQLINFVAFQNDVTARKRAEDALAASLAALRESEAQRDNLTSMIVHDMRSPLTVAMTSVGMLGRADAEVTGYAMDALKELNEMITSLLDVTRMEAGEMPIETRRVSLAALVAETLGGRARMDRRLTVAASGNGAMTNCDPSIIARVVNNLAGNALKFTPEDGRVEVTVISDGAWNRVEVRDTGPGIAPENHRRIFEKFGQVATARRTHSTGLGLAFCRLAVEAHGGSIGLSSALGAGSTFWFILPAGDGS